MKRGISLIVLIITIIIMIVISGAVILILLDNNVISKSENAKKVYNKKQFEELANVYLANILANDKNGKLTDAQITQQLLEDIEKSNIAGYTLTYTRKDGIIIEEGEKLPTEELYLIENEEVKVTMETLATTTTASVEPGKPNAMYASYAGSKIAMYTSQKININGYNKLELNANILSDTSSLKATVIVGLSNNKDNITDFIYCKQVESASTSWQNKTIELDLNDISQGEYYIKILLIHADNVSAYTCNVNIQNLKLIPGKKTPTNATETYYINGGEDYGIIGNQRSYGTAYTSSSIEWLSHGYKVSSIYYKTKTSVYTNFTVDISKLKTIEANIDLYANHNNLSQTMYVGISKTKEANLDFVRYVSCSSTGLTIKNTTVKLDVSDITGLYYIKCVLVHGDEVTAYTSEGVIKYLKTTNEITSTPYMKLNRKISGEELFNMSTVGVIKTNSSSVVIETDTNNNKYCGMYAAYASNMAYLYTNDKIDLTNIKKIILNGIVSSNRDNLTNTVYIGICDTKDNTITNFVKNSCCSTTGSYEKNIDLELDVSDIVGSYYIKCVLVHSSGVAAYTSMYKMYSLSMIN